jgi:mannitol/fructose-specific phosphotransferase system IIA component (Ntr-type)
MKFSDFIQRDAVTVPLGSSDRDGAIRELVASLGRSGAVEPDAVEGLIDGLLERERSGTTGFGRGVAVPHCKCAGVDRMVCAVGLSSAGLDFKALDGRPVNAVFVLLSPKGHNDGHLAAMEVVFRSLDQEAFRRALRGARTQADVLAILDQADAQPRHSVGLGRGH